MPGPPSDTASKKPNPTNTSSGAHSSCQQHQNRLHAQLCSYAIQWDGSEEHLLPGKGAALPQHSLPAPFMLPATREEQHRHSSAPGTAEADRGDAPKVRHLSSTDRDTSLILAPGFCLYYNLQVQVCPAEFTANLDQG